MTRNTFRFGRILLLALAWALMGSAGPAHAVKLEMGRVVAVEGEVYAKSPGEEARRLECDAPIFEYDQISSQRDSAGAKVRLGQRRSSAFQIGTNSAVGLGSSLVKGQDS